MDQRILGVPLTVITLALVIIAIATIPALLSCLVLSNRLTKVEGEISIIHMAQQAKNSPSSSSPAITPVLGPIKPATTSGKTR